MISIVVVKLAPLKVQAIVVAEALWALLTDELIGALEHFILNALGLRRRVSLNFLLLVLRVLNAFLCCSFYHLLLCKSNLPNKINYTH